MHACAEEEFGVRVGHNRRYQVEEETCVSSPKRISIGCARATVSFFTTPLNMLYHNKGLLVNKKSPCKTQ